MEGTATGLASVESLKLSSKLKTIGARAFDWCCTIKTITIPANVTTIKESAFSNCFDLESIIVGNKIKNIGKDAFKESKNVVIYGGSKSYVKKYAKKNKIKFVARDIAKKVTLNKKKVTLKKGDSIKLKATVKNPAYYSGSIKWKSSDTRIAIVNNKGIIKAKRKGKVTITVTAGKIKMSCKVIIK